MRNLKKVLALVLAVVMIFGVMSLTSATFTDDANVTNTEAVEVMAGLKILEGYTDGSYKPEGNVTREEMATIICKMLLGPDVAKTLAQGTSNFKDVEATRWSAGYIEYCANLGIIDGYGDGTFKPTGNVTIGEAAKMLLVAAGIKGTYTGADWLVNVTAAATSAKILPTSVDVRATATRDQVALYAFNALNYTTSTTVVYDVYKSGNGENTDFRATYTDATQAYLAKAVLGDTATIVARKLGNDSLGYKVFKLIGAEYTDKYGRPATLWYTDKNGNNQYDGKAFSDYFTAADEYLYLYVGDAALTYTTPIAAAQANELINAYQSQGYTVKVCGDTVAAKNAAIADVSVTEAVNHIVDNTGFGVLTEVFVGNGVVNIVITPETVYTVTGIGTYPQTTYQGAYTTYALTNASNTTSEFKQFTSHVKTAVENDDISWTGTPAVGSVATVTYPCTPVGGEPNSTTFTADATVLTNIVTGVVNSLDAAKSTIVINGTTYNIAKCFNKATLGVTDLKLLLGKTGTFYLDQYGYVAYTNYAETKNYAQANYVKIYDTQTSYGTSVSKAIEAQLVFEDGTTEVVKVDKFVLNGEAYTANDENGTKSLETYVNKTTGLWANGALQVYKYVKNEVTNTYTLTLEAVNDSNKTVTATQVFDGTHLTNNATTFVVRTGSAAAYKWNVYTGFANLPKLEAGECTVAVVDKNGDGIYDLVYITGNPDGYTTTEFVYVTSTNGTYTYAGDGTYTLTYPTADGKGLVVAYKADGTKVDGVDIAAPGLYKVTRYNAASAATVVAAVDAKYVKANGANGLILIGDEEDSEKNEKYWNYNNAKLVVYKDGVLDESYTFETLLRTSTSNYEYTVQAYVAPKLVSGAVGSSVVESTTDIDTLYVVITTNYFGA